MNEQPKVFVATPTSGGVARVKYVASLFALAVHLERRFGNLDGVGVAEQRDALAFHFLERSSATHILFVDSDIQFPPDLANKLLGRVWKFGGWDFGRSLNVIQALDVDREEPSANGQDSPEDQALSV